MRRTLIVVFFVGAAVVLWSWARQSKPPPVETPAEAPSVAQTLRPAVRGPLSPRLATPPTRPPDAGRPALPAPSDEQALLLQIRALSKNDPPRAEALARESRRRFPDGVTADERDALLVDALVNQQRIGRARDETYYYFDHHPDGRFAEHLFIMTGVHPRPPGAAR
jgi:hypothetical protein